MPQQQSNVRERQRNLLKEPRRYKVIIHNDDFTTMEFVVEVLKTVFFLSNEKAEELMLQVHHANKATNMAREKGFPLRLTVEPEEE